MATKQELDALCACLTAGKVRKCFVARTRNIYAGMVTRLIKKEYAPCGFTLLQLRQRAVRVIGKPCPYCGEKVTAKKLSLDHTVPLSRGGATGLKNVTLCCHSCNMAKGNLTGPEFKRLLALLGQFEEGIAKEVLGRLKAGASVVRLRFLKG